MTGVAPPVEVILFAVPETDVTVPVVVDSVPLVGNVTFVAPVKVKVAEKAPEVVNAPDKSNGNAPHEGAELEPDNKGNLAVAVPANIAIALALE